MCLYCIVLHCIVLYCIVLYGISGDVYGILIDPTKKRLWDQGYDREELDQRAEHTKQGGGGGGGFHRGGGFGGFY